MRDTKTTFIIVRFVCVGIAAVFLFGFSIYSYVEYSRLTSNGVETIGIVQSVSEKTRNSKAGSYVRYVAEIAFSDENDNHHVCSSESVDPFQIGQEIKMVYWKADPKVAERADSPKLIQRTYCYVFCIAMILLGVLGWNYHVFRRDYV